MVYKKDFVAAISCDGNILREERFQGVDVIKIPFGSHYSIILKNLSNKKCKVKIEIDGKNIADNKYFLIEPNTKQEIERFFEDNINKGHRFKFIKKTQEISNYRGDRIDDGIIRIEYQFQQPQKVILNENITCIKNEIDMPDENWCNKSVFHDFEEGITVKGRYSNQQFDLINNYIIHEEKNVINIRLMGFNSNGDEIIKPIITQKKLKCKNCGRRSSSINNFCPNCGTNLK